MLAWDLVTSMDTNSAKPPSERTSASTSGYYILVGGNLGSWMIKRRSRNQNTIARLGVKEKYRTMVVVTIYKLY